MAKIYIVALVIVEGIACTAFLPNANACADHAWYQAPPSGWFLSAPVTASIVEPALPSEVKKAIERLGADSYAEISQADAELFIGNLDRNEALWKAPGHLILIRALRHNLSGRFTIHQRGTETLVAFGVLGSPGKTIAWPVVTKLPELPSQLYITCSAAL